MTDVDILPAQEVSLEVYEKKVIYVYEHLDVKSHDGYIKVGETKASRISGDGENLRIVEQHEASNVAYKVLWVTEAVTNDGRIFSDRDIHKLLMINGIERETTQNPRSKRLSEWFKTDLETVQKVVNDFKASVVKDEQGIIKEYTLRAEQQDAIDITTSYFESCLNDALMDKNFLWNAKPRFGKTLTAYSFAQNIQAQKILILTNRPAIADSWFTDFRQFDFKHDKQEDDKHRWVFTATEAIKKRLESESGKNSLGILTREEQLKSAKTGEIYPNFIHFISLQDIKGRNQTVDVTAKKFKEKNKWIFKDQGGISWDLVIIDESHEGVDTDQAFDVLNNVESKFTLHLSGTPFKALASNKFKSNQIYNWSYTDEQYAKENWSVEDGHNPYSALPKLNIFTYQLSRALSIRAEEAKQEGSDFAFDLGEFFKTNSSGDHEFVHKDHVKQFLDNLANVDFEYPYSDAEKIDSVRHSLWLLPGVQACKSLKNLLNEHPYFSDFNVVVAAGTGTDDQISSSALENVRIAIGGNHVGQKHPLETKTITLSCGQLTTGVTVPEWSAVLMLSNVKSPSVYMQTAFRAQNPFEVLRNKSESFIKENCYVFDFAPDRILETIKEIAINSSSHELKSSEQRIKELINFLPVIAEDDEGRMKELDANQVMTLPLKLITHEVISRGFMSNRLFDNISGIFGAPQSVRDILDKIAPEAGGFHGDPAKNRPTGKSKIRVDNAGRIHINEEIVINTSNGLLGDKQYAVVDSDDGKEVLSIIEGAKTQMEAKKYSEDEKKKILARLTKALPTVVDEMPDPVPGPGDDGYVQKEELESMPKAKEKSEEEKVRERLRGFARTIPSFLMAYGDGSTSLFNFEERVPDEVFLDLTSITKTEFRKLRDGFDYEEEDESGAVVTKRFNGFFNDEIFNASVQAFLEKKAELASYYLTDNVEDIFEYIPPQATNQIFTPKSVVTMMVDKLESEFSDLFQRTDSTFIDLYMKSGLYITEVTRRLFKNTRKQHDSDFSCIKHILENQVFGLAPTEVLQAITSSFIFGFDTELSIDSKNFKLLDLTKSVKDDNLEYEITKSVLYKALNESGKVIKFDAVVGNPPYQENLSQTENQNQGNTTWVYYMFQNFAEKIGKLTCLIYPFGGWFDSPNSLQKFGKKILSDGHTIAINAFEGSSDKRVWYRTDTQPQPIFGNNANLSAGVAIVIRDLEEVHSVYEYSNRAYSNSVREIQVDEIDLDLLTPNPDFAINGKLGTRKLEKRVLRSPFKIEADFASKNADALFSTKSNLKDPIEVRINHVSGSAGRTTVFWAERSIIEFGHDMIPSFKVLITSAYPQKTLINGNPTLSGVKNRLATIIEKQTSDSVFGSSRLCLFHSIIESECDNFIKYTKTDFFARLTLEEPNRRSTFGFVIPDQDFSDESDIDWSQSISNIDKQLLKKYGFSKAEFFNGVNL